MIKTRKLLALGAVLPFLLLADLSPEAPLGLSFVREANAIIGVPRSPVSVAGVARRTTRRAVAVTTSTSSQQKAVVTGAPAVGSMVSSLPAGCVTTPKGGVEYYNCAGVYYRAAFQGNNLVYVVQQP